MLGTRTQLAGALVWARRERASRAQSGQAMVESAIVIPLMVFLILGVIQLVMMQHARIMTEYAAFNAARSGVVWNADRAFMESAAIISLLPTYEGLFEEADLNNPGQMIKRIAQRALLYQVNRRLPQAIDVLRNGALHWIDKIPSTNWLGDKANKYLGKGADMLFNIAHNAADSFFTDAITGALGPGDDRLVSVEITNPKSRARGWPPSLGDIWAMRKKPFGSELDGEVDFDDPENRSDTRLSIRVRYLYMMRVPFANWVIHQAWLAGRTGKQLYGAIWNPQERVGETGLRSVAPAEVQASGDKLLEKLATLAKQGVYMMPLEATYTMRMQSNPYKSSLQVQ